MVKNKIHPESDQLAAQKINAALEEAYNNIVAAKNNSKQAQIAFNDLDKMVEKAEAHNMKVHNMRVARAKDINARLDEDDWKKSASPGWVASKSVHTAIKNGHFDIAINSKSFNILDHVALELLLGFTESKEPLDNKKAIEFLNNKKFIKLLEHSLNDGYQLNSLVTFVIDIAAAVNKGNGKHPDTVVLENKENSQHVDTLALGTGESSKQIKSNEHLDIDIASNEENSKRDFSHLLYEQKKFIYEKILGNEEIKQKLLNWIQKDHNRSVEDIIHLAETHPYLIPTMESIQQDIDWAQNGDWETAHKKGTLYKIIEKFEKAFPRLPSEAVGSVKAPLNPAFSLDKITKGLGNIDNIKKGFEK